MQLFIWMIVKNVTVRKSRYLQADLINLLDKFSRLPKHKQSFMFRLLLHTTTNLLHPQSKLFIFKNLWRICCLLIMNK